MIQKILVSFLACLLIPLASNAQDNSNQPSKPKIKVNGHVYGGEAPGLDTDIDNPTPRTPPPTMTTPEPIRSSPITMPQQPSAEQSRQTTRNHPLAQFSVDYQPGTIGYSQSRSSTGTAFDLSYLTYLSLAGAVDVYITKAFTLGANINFMYFDKSAEDVGTYSLQKTSVSIISPTVNGRYCFDTGNTQICPKVILGYDSFPVLQAQSAFSYEMTTVTDMVAGVAVDVQFAITNSMNGLLEIGYMDGLAQNQNNSTPLSKDDKLFGLMQVDYRLNPFTQFIGGLYANSYQATFDMGGDTWSLNATTVGIFAGFKWTL